MLGPEHAGRPGGDTAKQQATATACALGGHDDQICVGSIVYDAFGGSSVRDPISITRSDGRNRVATSSRY